MTNLSSFKLVSGVMLDIIVSLLYQLIFMNGTLIFFYINFSFGYCCVLQFNRNPTKGMQYLISNMLVEKNPTSVAQFLKNTPSLDKVRLFPASKCIYRF